MNSTLLAVSRRDMGWPRSGAELAARVPLPLRSCFEELYLVALKTVPAIIINAGEYSMLLNDILLLLRLGKGHVASYAVAMAILGIAWALIEGLLSAQDGLAAHAYETDDFKGVQYWSLVSFVVAFVALTIASGVLSFAFVITEDLLFIKYHVAHKAAIYVLLSLPSLYLLAAYRVLQKYFHAQGVYVPSMVGAAVGNLANAALNFLLIFAAGLGLWGCVLSTALSRLLMVATLLYHVYLHVDDSCRLELRLLSTTRAIRAYRVVRKSLVCAQEVLLQLYDQYVTREPVRARRKRRKEERKVQMTLLSPRRRGGSDDGSSDGSSDGSEAGVDGIDVSAGSDDDDDDDDGINGEEEQEEDALDGYAYDEYISEEDLSAGLAGRVRSKGVRAQQLHRHVAGRWLLAALSSLRGGGPPAAGPTSSAGAGAEGARYIDDDAAGEGENKLYVQLSLRSLLTSCARYVFLGLPGALVMALESWQFDVYVLITVHMGSVACAATVVLILLLRFLHYTLPFSLASVITLRLHRLLVQNRAAAARNLAWLSIAGVLAVYGLLGGALLLLGRSVAAAMSPLDGDVGYRISSLSPLAAAALVAHSVQAVAQGVLRGVCRFQTMLFLTFLTTWALGLPAGVYLAYFARPTFELYGFWIGIASGYALNAATLVLLVLAIDWEYEVKRATVRARRQQSRGGYEYLVYPRAGSLALGGLPGCCHSSKVAEMDELEEEAAVVTITGSGAEEIEMTDVQV